MDLTTAILIIMGLLTVGFVSVRFARWFRIPHSVFLVVIGGAAGYWLRQKGLLTNEQFGEHLPHLVFSLLLPPLIFEAAYHFDLADLRKDLSFVLILACGGLIVSALIVGTLFNSLFGFSLAGALAFGALISATDPVATVALFRELGIPKRLIHLMEGESLFNDATSIVLFKVFLGITAFATFSLPMIFEATWTFISVGIGGVLVGFGIGLFQSLFLRLTSDSAPAQLGITVASAFGSFLIAEHFFHVSGVMATVATGLVLGLRARMELNREALHGMNVFWEFFALASNTMVFFLVGLWFNPEDVLKVLAIAPAAVGIVLFARIVCIFGFVSLLNVYRKGEKVSLEYQAAMAWGGLRGALAIALVLMIPDSIPEKTELTLLATMVVFFTLFVNALTMKGVLNALNLTSLGLLDQSFLRNTLNMVQNTVFAPLGKIAGSGGLSTSVLGNVDKRFGSFLETLSPNTNAKVEKVAGQSFSVNSLLLNERSYYEERLEEGALSKEAFVRLNRTVDDRLTLYGESGISGLSSYDFQEHRPFWLFVQKFLKVKSFRASRLRRTLEVLLNIRAAIEETGEFVRNKEVQAVAALWIKRIGHEIDKFHRLYPDLSTGIQFQFVGESAVASAQKTVRKMYEHNVINALVRREADMALNSASMDLHSTAKKYLNPTIKFLFGRVPLFARVPEKMLDILETQAKKRFVPEGGVIVREGDSGESFFLVVSGVLEVSGGKIGGAKKPRLFTGEYFGELSLLFGAPRSATVSAVTPVQVIELKKEAFDRLLGNLPDLKEEIIHTARIRLGLEKVAEAAPPQDVDGGEDTEESA